ncbi:AAA family ATPase [Flexivirga oryzae]|uniref:Chloramphenicol 3-O-phosphotransferase n=1 Tax=Flexivirga oryzae TaxID=1794944 RepID=A0A839MY20_9MICO|nr:AAA family ATPase [Flexivirga oryzae]MBB2890298.1 chloramphenicol 3-O-phosphotransferase [Flexivirga oryzae]
MTGHTVKPATASGTGTGRLFVISGAQAAGKTTVGQALADALPRSVFIDGDTIGNVVVSGKALMTQPPRIEAIEQLFLRYAGALTVADVYRSAGFDAVIADNIFGSYLDDFLMIAAPEPVHFVMLTPSVDVIRAREISRGKNAYRHGFTVEGLVDTIEHDTFRVGLWIDNTSLSPGQTVTRILRRTEEALIDTREFEQQDEAPAP